jgi:hypothetical protein
MEAAEEEYFDKIWDEANQLMKSTMSNWPKQSSGGRR